MRSGKFSLLESCFCNTISVFLFYFFPRIGEGKALIQYKLRLVLHFYSMNFALAMKKKKISILKRFPSSIVNAKWEKLSNL